MPGGTGLSKGCTLAVSTGLAHGHPILPSCHPRGCLVLPLVPLHCKDSLPLLQQGLGAHPFLLCQVYMQAPTPGPLLLLLCLGSECSCSPTGVLPPTPCQGDPLCPSSLPPPSLVLVVKGPAWYSLGTRRGTGKVLVGALATAMVCGQPPRSSMLPPLNGYQGMQGGGRSEGSRCWRFTLCFSSPRAVAHPGVADRVHRQQHEQDGSRGLPRYAGGSACPCKVQPSLH